MVVDFKMTDSGRINDNERMSYGLRTLSIGCLITVTAFVTACESVRAVQPDLAAIRGPSISGDPCQKVDWFEVGRVDGLSGIPRSTSGYVGRCVSRGAHVDEELYEAGWQRGLVDYCRPERAFDAGRNGESYADVCPENLEPAFLKRFELGRKIHDLEKKNAALEKEMNQRTLELETLSAPSTESVLGDALSRLPDSNVVHDAEAKKKREASLQLEIKNLRDDLTGNESAIHKLEATKSL